MKVSKFNLWVNDYPHKGEHLLYNSRTQALLKVNQELKDTLDTLKGTRVEENLDALKSNGIIVESEQEEQAKLDAFFKQLKYGGRNLPFEVTILTTYSCNFRCVYCFEESVKEYVFLDKETSGLIVRWIKQRAEKRKFRKIFLVYYGGEPLLNVKPIYDISCQMQEWAQKNGLEFGFGIITNGSLINHDLIDKLLTVGLREIRISIDGDRNAHNKKRPFLDGSPSFDCIVNNIKGVINKVDVAVAGNFDRENVESIPRLLDYLEREDILYKLRFIDFAPLAARLGPKDNPGAIELGGCLSFFNKGGLFKEIIEIKKELMRRGLPMVTGLAVNACSMIMEDGGVAIDPKGVIYTCNGLIGYPQFSVGNVREEEFNPRHREFLNIDAWNKCPKDCPYLPLCQGGCRFFSYLEHRNIYDICCKREYLDTVVPELIKLEYEKLMQSSPPAEYARTQR